MKALVADVQMDHLMDAIRVYGKRPDYVNERSIRSILQSALSESANPLQALSDDEIRMLWVDFGGWSHECPFDFARGLLAHASRVAPCHEPPSDAELLEVAREETEIYGEGATVLDLETMLRVLRSVARRFAIGAAAASDDARDAIRYRWLRSRNLDAINRGGVFAGRTPDNVVLNGDDLDRAVDGARPAEPKDEEDDDD